jgi:hypothetical protein
VGCWRWKKVLTLILLRWRIWWAPNNASKLQLEFNSAFKGLNNFIVCLHNLNYPACKVIIPNWIVIYGLSRSTTFCHVISEKKVTENKIFVLIFSSNISETLLLQKIIEWNIIIHVRRPSYQVPVNLITFQ